MEQNCKFDREHYEEHFCDFILNLYLLFKDILFLALEAILLRGADWFVQFL